MTVVYIRKIELDALRPPAELTALRSKAVRKLLADCLHERFGELAWTLEKAEEGKPYLTSPVCDLPQISLSHSGEWAVCALSDAPVGVDVQVVRPISVAVLARFLPDAKPDCDDRAQTRLWTRYEACLKRYGSRAEMLVDAPDQRYDSLDLDNAVVTVCHGDDVAEWINYGTP